MERCQWCLGSEKMISYHDEEWGVPLYDDQKPVSYTHLDVYKRQPMFSATLLRLGLKA